MKVKGCTNYSGFQRENGGHFEKEDFGGLAACLSEGEIDEREMNKACDTCSPLHQ